MKTVEELKEDILALNDQGLAEVIHFAIAELRNRRLVESREKAAVFRTGQGVSYVGSDSARLPAGAKGRIRKVNRRTVSVDFGPHGSWRIDASLLQPLLANVTPVNAPEKDKYIGRVHAGFWLDAQRQTTHGAAVKQLMTDLCEESNFAVSAGRTIATPKGALFCLESIQPYYSREQAHVAATAFARRIEQEVTARNLAAAFENTQTSISTPREDQAIETANAAIAAALDRM